MYMNMKIVHEYDFYEFKRFDTFRILIDDHVNSHLAADSGHGGLWE